jgi:HPt (histidine-containing phosphotransfer) domain-containing protein
MDDFLSKPLRLEQLDHALRRWIRGEPPSHQAEPRAEEAARLLDRAALDAIRSLEAGQPGLLARVIDAYLAGAVERIAVLREAIAFDDAASLARGAHVLASSSAQVGIAAIADLCRQLEALGRSGSTKGAGDTVGEIDDLLRRLRPVLARERQQAPGAAGETAGERGGPGDAGGWDVDA